MSGPDGDVTLLYVAAEYRAVGAQVRFKSPQFDGTRLRSCYDGLNGRFGKERSTDPEKCRWCLTFVRGGGVPRSEGTGLHVCSENLTESEIDGQTRKEDGI